MSSTKTIKLLNEHRLRLMDVLGRPGGGLYRQYLGREIRQQVDFTSKEIKSADIRLEAEEGKQFFAWKKDCPKELKLDSGQREALLGVFKDLPPGDVDQIITDMVFQLVGSREQLEALLKMGGDEAEKVDGD
jgi:hypothetical protein